MIDLTKDSIKAIQKNNKKSRFLQPAFFLRESNEPGECRHLFGYPSGSSQKVESQFDALNLGK